MSATKHYAPTHNVELVDGGDLPMPPSMQLVSSMHVEQRGGHDHITLYNRGGRAGEIVVNAGDGAALAVLLELSELRP